MTARNFGSMREMRRLMGSRWAVLLLLGTLGACDSPNTAEGPFRGPDGGRFVSTCMAPAVQYDACGVVDGQPFYAFYDGCNWCRCVDGDVSCTTRACIWDADAGVDPFAFVGQCNVVFFGVGPTPAPGETWVCDEDGRLFRSVCLPASVNTP